jgi:hypothetical protein
MLAGVRVCDEAEGRRVGEADRKRSVAAGVPRAWGDYLPAGEVPAERVRDHAEVHVRRPCPWWTF